MPEITYEESLRQTNQLGRRAREAGKADDLATAIDLWRELLAHPCAHHQVVAYEVWDDIHQLYRRAGNYDAAIDAKQTAIELGYRSEPDPEADIAECHLDAGRRAEADRIFTDLRARTPDDVWLYNAAGFSYAHTGDHREAERWFRDGIAVALRTGDPDQVVMQLLDLLDVSLARSARSPTPSSRGRSRRSAKRGSPSTSPARGAMRPSSRNDRVATAASSRNEATRRWTSGRAGTANAS